MKKFFQHTKRPRTRGLSRDEWENYEEEYYAAEGESGEEYYAEDGESGEEYYAEDGESGEEYYAEEGEFGEEYYAEDSESGEEFYAGEVQYEDDARYDVDYRGGQKRQDKKDKDTMHGKFRKMSVIDKMIAGAGVAVAVMGLVTGIALAGSRAAGKQEAGFAGVGARLKGIELIGGKGMLAVANAQIARLEAAAVGQEPEETAPPEEEDPEYTENEYSRQVDVKMNTTSIQKDLKIKFTNQKTGKLVPNVPFSVTVTDPKGKTGIWSDDDMDGIIHKKDIEPGTYTIAMEKLTDTKYASYSISTASVSATVKRNIAYEKVDVGNEVKAEAEVDAKKEDTVQHETVVESVLQDTVPWVESTAVANSYQEVPKSGIQDPLTNLKVAGVLYKEFLRIAKTSITVDITSSAGGKIRPGGTTQLTAPAKEAIAAKIKENANETITVTDITNVKWSCTSTPETGSTGTEAARVDQAGLVTGVAPGTAVITYSATAKVTVETKSEIVPDSSESGGDENQGGTTGGGDGSPTDGSDSTESTDPPASSEPAESTNHPAGSESAESTPSSSAEESASSADNNESAAGEARRSARTQTTVKTETTTKDVAITGSITITVEAEKAQPTLEVDKKELSVVVKGTATAQAMLKGFAADKKPVYEVSSDKEAIARAEVDAAGKVTVTGVAAGTAEITVTVKYDAGGTAGAATGTTETALKAKIKVTVSGNKTIELSSTATLAYVANPLTLSAFIKGAVTAAPKVTVESSDTNVMKAAAGTLKAENNAITVPVTLDLLKEGSATLTVKCEENGETVKATCAVTVRANPKTDTQTPLKDKSNNPLYVKEQETYRQAAYADYYTHDKFYINKGTTYTGWQTIGGHVYYYTAEGKHVTGEQVIQGAKYTFASDGTLVTGTGTLGIDVSKWNGTIDWNAVKNSGISYVIIRCGYRGSSTGALIEDPKFKANIKGAAAVGLKVGVYFFTQAVDEREAVEEASMVLGLIKNYKISYPVFLDVESSGGRADAISKEARTAVCRAFCETVQKSGYTAGIYANKIWLEKKMDAAALSAYKIWLAQYVGVPTYTARYDLWQYRSTGKVSGISGNVDMNLSYLGY